jgi:[glutamine synthetase] adenylyltransferase / [glutamine synthetase]-adenylyl-L-tyrosine phosphorylase
MNPSAQLVREVSRQKGNLDPKIVGDFLNRMEADYPRSFQPAEIARHLQALSKLSGDNPVQVILDKEAGPDGAIECTVLAFDHPFEFSSITGLMAGTGFSIESSDAFTLKRVKSAPAPRLGVRRARPAPHPQRDPMRDAVILDFFRGQLLGPITDFKIWSREFKAALEEIMRLLDDEEEHSTERAKRLVNERVTQWLKESRRAKEKQTDKSPDVSVELLPEATRLHLWAPANPATLYALGTALSLNGLQIEKTRARTVNGQTFNEIDLVDAYGKPIIDPERIGQLRSSVLLTQQFAFYLDRSPDPFTALKRFEELSQKIVQIPERGQWLALLSNPLSMADLAKVLGASDFLWDDFIRWHTEALLPVFQRHALGRELWPPARSLPRRLEEALAGVKDFEQQREKLNQFKDHELFLIDMDHILSGGNPDVAFQILSERLVFLAENLVSAAVKFVYAELRRLYGEPKDHRGRVAPFAVFGLGKLGGVALGYASDLELLFLYDGDGTTRGGARGCLENGEFFSILTRETSASIVAKREGIFQIDLRLRPFGGSGPLACSAQQFAEYYSPKGEAHPFERLALARLRWIAGDARLGCRIEQIRDQVIYENPEMEAKAIWEISDKMRAQHATGKQLNSKHSAGALADLEETVQMLQVMHAADAPQLRTPRLQEALRALRRGQILSAAEFDDLMGAYDFYRRLINAQRMLRGSAKDLLLPEAGSDELLHLARRMKYPLDAAADVDAKALLDDFQRYTKIVRQFIKKRLGR